MNYPFIDLHIALMHPHLYQNRSVSLRGGVSDFGKRRSRSVDRFPWSGGAFEGISVNAATGICDGFQFDYCLILGLYCFLK